MKQRRENRRRWAALFLGIFLLNGLASHAQTNPTPGNPCTPWPATDALGRTLPLADEVGPPRSDRFVGIFYFLWHHQRPDNRGEGGPYDVSRILAADPEAVTKPDSPLWGPLGAAHYWGEPLFGYYLNTDPWVLRRHASLLADAGIDMLIFDTTNAVTYPDAYSKLCEVFSQVRKEGGRTPQIAFMMNAEAGKTAEQIYNDLYKPERYRDLWFYWQGKPLLLCDPAQASPELRQFFTLRRTHWPDKRVNTSNAWHWEAIYPQVYGYTEDPNKAEQVNVSVAQNLLPDGSGPTNMSFLNGCGRSFHEGKQDSTPNAVNRGLNFQEQWKRAHELQPPFVMITGWNEWIAGRFHCPGNPAGSDAIVFVDQFEQEFSRDIEPMKGGHGDNYYWQLAANVRQFKGAPPLPKASAPVSIHLGGDFGQWREVEPEFQDHVGETIPRDYDGIAGLHYTNDTGHNDFVMLKVARDEKNVYFYARTWAPLTSPSNPNWMWLLIDADQDATTGWHGYDLLVNRNRRDGLCTVERNSGGAWNWEKMADVPIHWAGSELELTVPRDIMGFEVAKGALHFDFKWADNLSDMPDIMDFYSTGDVAPDARLNYRFLSIP